MQIYIADNESNDNGVYFIHKTFCCNKSEPNYKEIKANDWIEAITIANGNIEYNGIFYKLCPICMI